ncbi:mannose-specific PTS system component IID [Lactococcus cremoris subsp. cremoris UC509.9]|uniref:PTS system mannose/fructose/sorbose family transporter subunit IID n=1 Tax=Lactococcus lactis subsp. cremoris TaxID=1359 RepID=A0AAJ6MJP5_LACLC|nr:PTS system mannose/fructose/sorbose family transporter subunit IID [Lactococcus cremoris]AFW92115.1 mannose-specific PTS system component IID [Lactococcus cremoris subsp. cremoris UC509.9]ARD91845.1 PTS system mannose/fructose/sorbose family transporter subunit IID [Lactococcus cremoris]MRM68736.1 PTS mannose family transporter subunit IID [Lactococcus cremoris]QJD20359.1 PTS mannose/fructose/sorbose transporter family subunit IID [Lactococcus cremoris]QRZ30376.1 mannose-specific PTS system
MSDKKVTLDKKIRRSVMWRSMFLQGSWNYERMQNGGWAYSLIPALKKLYPSGEEAKEALKRHLEFFNTHPYVAAPIIGVTLALEEERANGADIDDAAIQGVKVGMMGPLAGIGDPVFWFTVRPIVGAIAASLAVGGSIIAPLFFFIVWNAIRITFLWYTQEFGYKSGSAITKDLGGGLLQTVTKGASILGMFVLGVLIQRWVTINFNGANAVVSKIPLQKGSYVEFPKGSVSGTQLHEILGQVGNKLSLVPTKVTYLQDNLNQLIPGLAGLLITFLCMWLLKKKVSPIVIIFGLFIVGILGRWAQIM